MIDPVNTGASPSATAQLAKQSVQLDQQQVAATASAQQNTQQNVESQNQVGPPQVNTGLTGEAPESTDTDPGANLNITA